MEAVSTLIINQDNFLWSVEKKVRPGYLLLFGRWPSSIFNCFIKKYKFIVGTTQEVAELRQ